MLATASTWPAHTDSSAATRPQSRRCVRRPGWPRMPYVYNHPMARGLVENLLRRAQPTAYGAGLTGVERAIDLG